MNKERTTDLILEGEIADEQIAQIPEDFQGTITVNGNICCSGPCIIPGNLLMNGDLEAPKLEVKGELHLNDRCAIVTDDEIYVHGSLSLSKNCEIQTDRLNIGGNFFIPNGNIYATDINVVGDIIGEGYIDATNITVKEKFQFSGNMNLNDGKIYVGHIDF